MGRPTDRDRALADDLRRNRLLRAQLREEVARARAISVSARVILREAEQVLDRVQRQRGAEAG